MPTPPLSDDLAREAVEAWQRNQFRTSKAAAELNVNYHAFRTRLKIGKARGFHLSEGVNKVLAQSRLNPAEAKGGWLHAYNDEGKKVGTTYWRPADEDDGTRAEDVADRIAARMNAVVPAPAIQRPTQTRGDLLNFLPIFDVHLGMRVGSFGTAAAVARLLDGAFDVLDRAPPAETIVILTGGDYTEANDASALTPAHKHPLAVDIEFDDLADIAVDTKVAIIERALTRYDRVIYQSIRANHDPAMMQALRQALRQRYRDTDRFVLKDGFDLFTHSWEGNLIAAIHGHQKVTKPELLALAIATRHAVDWGAAKSRELWRGHMHKELVVGVPGMRVCQVNAIAPAGRYANENLFTGDSDIQCVTYKRGGGRQNVVTHIFDPVLA